MIKAIKNNAVVLFRSKFLLLILVLMSGFVVYGTYILYGKKVSPVQPLGNVMCLTVYLFFAMMFISYEYIQKFYNNGIYEILRVSDNKRKNIISAFAVLFIFSGILCTILSILVIKEFLFFSELCTKVTLNAAKAPYTSKNVISSCMLFPLLRKASMTRLVSISCLDF